MSRAIITYDQRRNASAGLARKPGESAPPPEDTYKDRLLKYIPGEVVTLYITLTAILKLDPGMPSWLGWAVFLVGVVGTWLYMRVHLGVEDLTQLCVSTLSFAIWVFALGGPFCSLGWYKPIYGGLLLPVFTFFIAIRKTAPSTT